ncbi:MAG: hypothetical protein LUH02_04975, partial [Erysipelotrichaceae bacterium]|nr:hypothetical protein [Erysipelotrichaceae bacterium]
VTDIILEYIDNDPMYNKPIILKAFSNPIILNWLVNAPNKRFFENYVSKYLSNGNFNKAYLKYIQYYRVSKITKPIICILKRFYNGLLKITRQIKEEKTKND